MLLAKHSFHIGNFSKFAKFGKFGHLCNFFLFLHVVISGCYVT